MGLNYDLWDTSENLRRMNHFEKSNKANTTFFEENANFFEYYVRILTLKIGDNLWDALCNKDWKEVIFVIF